MARTVRIVCPGFDLELSADFPHLDRLHKEGTIGVMPRAAEPSEDAFDYYLPWTELPRLNGIPAGPMIERAWRPTVEEQAAMLDRVCEELQKRRTSDLRVYYAATGMAARHLRNLPALRDMVYAALNNLVGEAGPENVLLIASSVATAMREPRRYGRGNSGGVYFVEMGADGYALYTGDVGGTPYYVRGRNVAETEETLAALIAGKKTPQASAASNRITREELAGREDSA